MAMNVFSGILLLPFQSRHSRKAHLSLCLHFVHQAGHEYSSDTSRPERQALSVNGQGKEDPSQSAGLMTLMY